MLTNVHNFLILGCFLLVKNNYFPRNHLCLIIFRIFASVIACNYKIQVNSLAMDEN